MRLSRFILHVACIAASTTLLSAQLTLINKSILNPGYSSTTGTTHSLDTTNKQVGLASIARGIGSSNSSYLNTGVGLDPTTGSVLCGSADKGFTIQFWYRPSSPTAFAYLMGDRTWTGSAGAFRTFQNGAAGGGNVILRGPLTQVATTGSPLTTATNAAGWVHFVVVLNGTASPNTITWYVNGTQNNTGNTTITGKGKNFTCMGYNGSSSAGAAGNYDDFRIYGFARSAADIKADYLSAATGSGTCLNIPDLAYYDCDAAVNIHSSGIATNTEPDNDLVRLFADGDTIKFNATSPATGPFPSFTMLNVNLGGPGSPRQDAYQLPTAPPGGPYSTLPLFPGLILGSPFSTPANPVGFLWPGYVTYGGGSVGQISQFIPAGLGLTVGDRIDIQFISGDPSYPTGFGVTNHTSFQYVKSIGVNNVHVEARGGSALQDTGFFEVWNTGSIPIKSVTIDFTPIATSTTWTVAGALNSGGTLAAGTSFRHKTAAICDLTPAANPRFTIDTTMKILKFTFNCTAAGGFEGPENHFIFDCRTSQGGNGSLYIGAKVTVEFCVPSLTKTGNLVADPNDPNAAQVDL